MAAAWRKALKAKGERKRHQREEEKKSARNGGGYHRNNNERKRININIINISSMYGMAASAAYVAKINQ